jgi:hypothetical protein
VLTIVVPGDEYFDEEKQQFVTKGDVILELEHSLVSLSKWESKFEKPFLVPGVKSNEEDIEYIKAMTLTPNIPPGVFSRLSKENIQQINDYIGSKMTATWFNETSKGPKSGEVVTSELIYYWMVAFKIPFQAETWNLNRLLTLIRICNVKSQKPKKMSKSEILARNRELNAKRRAELRTAG